MKLLQKYQIVVIKLLPTDRKSNKPFFAYLAYTAFHYPLHAPQTYIDKYKDTYADGYEALQKKRFKRLQTLAYLPESLELPAWTEKDSNF